MSVSNLLTNNLKSYQNLNVNSVNAKNITAENLDFANVEIDTLKVDNIEELTLANGININNKLKVDNIGELTPANGVVIKNDLKVENIFEENLGIGVRVNNTLRVDRITELTGSAKTTFPDGIKVSVIESILASPVIIASIDCDDIGPFLNTTLQVELPVAKNLGDEYGEYQMGFNIDSVFVGASSIVTVNAGNSNYLFTVNGNDLECQYDGVYSINIVLINNAILGLDTDVYAVRIRDTVSTQVLAIGEKLAGINLALNTYHVGCSFVGKLSAGDIIRFEGIKSRGAVGAKPFGSNVFVSRIK